MWSVLRPATPKPRPGPARRALAVLAAVFLASAALVAPAGAAPPAPPPGMSGQPDGRIFRGPVPRSASALVPRSAAIPMIDATAAAGSDGGKEPSIAVNPADPNKIAITRFNATWNDDPANPTNADLLYSQDGGATWAEETTIPQPTGLTVSAGTTGCPCDQTIDYDRSGNLYGTFLIEPTATTRAVVTGSTADPTRATEWKWNGDPAQLTNASGTRPDQPWLVVNRDNLIANRDNAYIGYDDFNPDLPDIRVAASNGTIPVNIGVDRKAGTGASDATNPGLRLAADPRDGTMYALYEKASGDGDVKDVTYKLNRSTDAGQTWTLNADAEGMTVATVSSDQATFKFGGVNALLGGVDHVAVDPGNGDVYVAYGEHVAGAHNRIMVNRLTPDGSGGLQAGTAVTASASNDAALPSIAVTSDGSVGVLYDTFDGPTADGFPTFTAHLARSADHGATFTDTVLQTFQSPVKDDGTASQRVLGDFQQLKAVGNTFYGVFAGNLDGVPSANPPIHAIFFKAPQALNKWDVIGNTNPDGTVVADAGSSILRIHDAGGDATATCGSSQDSGSVPNVTGSDGTPIGTITSADFHNCVLAGLFSLSVTTDGLPWNIDVVSQSGDVVSGEIIGIGANISGAGCTARIAGPGDTGDGSVPFTYDNGTGQMTVGPGGNLTVFDVSGCFGLIADGDPAELLATYDITPPVQITME